MEMVEHVLILIIEKRCCPLFLLNYIFNTGSSVKLTTGKNQMSLDFHLASKSLEALQAGKCLYQDSHIIKSY